MRASALLGLGLLLLGGLFMASPAGAQELFSWWSRGLLPIELIPGEWVEVERREFFEGQALTDTVRVSVHEAEGTLRWIQLVRHGGDSRWLLLVNPASLESGGHLLDALERLIELKEGHPPREESLHELRSSRVLRRHFEDLFEEPVVQTSDLPDTNLNGQAVARRGVSLSEERSERTAMGDRTLIHRTIIRSRAELGPEVPVFGLLGSRTEIEVSSSWEPASDQRASLPLFSELELRTLDWGNDAPVAPPLP